MFQPVPESSSLPFLVACPLDFGVAPPSCKWIPCDQLISLSPPFSLYWICFSGSTWLIQELSHLYNPQTTSRPNPTSSSLALLSQTKELSFLLFNSQAVSQKYSGSHLLLPFQRPCSKLPIHSSTSHLFICYWILPIMLWYVWVENLHTGRWFI